MRKVSMGLLLGLIVGVAAVAFIRAGWANLKVTVEPSGCLDIGCHAVGVFGTNDGSMHGSHSNCADCHAEQTTFLGDVFSASCLDCHPDPDSDLCDLSVFMEQSLNYNPTGLSCYECHSQCRTTSTTTTATGTSTSTTTTIPRVTIKGKRFEIFLIGPFREGCRSTSVNFRSDNVLILDCLDGFGSYLSIGTAFTGVYWSNNYYLGYGMGMILSGIASDAYIIAGGVAYYNNMMSPVVMSGYKLSIP